MIGAVPNQVNGLDSIPKQKNRNKGQIKAKHILKLNELQKKEKLILLSLEIL